MVNLEKPELLAPAGDLKRLEYALAYGADAVYAGQPAFSLRARENGFRTKEDLKAGIRMCHAAGKKFYLTSNVIARNSKVEPFQRALLEALELGPDALIVADPGIVSFVRKESPKTPVHISVQANTTNYLTARFWQGLGATRVILSRELRLKEVLEIREKCPGLELEVFVHGNVCMAMSGRCMLSNWTTHRDANQGMCNNSCRMPYRLYANPEVQTDDYREHEGEFFLERSNSEEKPEPIALDEDRWGTYFMSSRDLCALEAVPDLVRGKIESFKIEGRTRSVYYLSAVVLAYRKAIDAALEGKEVPEISRELISDTDSRGRMPGFFAGPLPQNYASTQEPSRTGAVAAQVTSVDDDGTVHVLVKNRFDKTSVLKWLDPETFETVGILGMEGAKGAPVEVLHPGTEGRLHLSSSVTNRTKFKNFAFLVLQKQENGDGVI